jgi:hypothetical protein
MTYGGSLLGGTARHGLPQFDSRLRYGSASWWIMVHGDDSEREVQRLGRPAEVFGIGLLCVAAAGWAQMPVKPPAGPPKAQVASAPTPALDLASLEQRLRDTKAIGVFTKLSLKNQVDDLLRRFRDFYGKKGTVTLAELRQKYDLLLLKVLSVLQDGDPALAAMISASREAIWGILADPVRFSKL